jgi:hypothetical protein
MSPYSSVWALKPNWDRRLAHLAGDDRAVDARVLGDLAQRGLERAAHDGDAGVLVGVGAGQAFERLGAMHQRHAAADDDAFLHRGAGGVQRVVDAVLALLHLDLGRMPPTRITATPPASFASRSCSFSRS